MESRLFEEMVATQAETCTDVFLKTARQELAEYSASVGLVIYSPVQTLARNPVAFWGFNPGQDPNVSDPTHWTIADALRQFPTQTESLLMQVWPDAKAGTTEKAGKTVYRRAYPAGCAPYQRGLRYLLSAIKTAEHNTNSPEPLVTNLLFLQTASASQAVSLANINNIVQRCWRVHEAIFAISKPRVLITTAGVLEFVRRFKLMPLTDTGESIQSGYSNWCCKKWETVVKHGEMAILQLPHMAYWGGCIERKRCEPAVKWIVQMVGMAIENTA